jgi:hypothetical protein
MKGRKKEINQTDQEDKVTQKWFSISFFRSFFYSKLESAGQQAGDHVLNCVEQKQGIQEPQPHRACGHLRHVRSAVAESERRVKQGDAEEKKETKEHWRTRKKMKERK